MSEKINAKKILEILRDVRGELRSCDCEDISSAKLNAIAEECSEIISACSELESEKEMM